LTLNKLRGGSSIISKKWIDEAAAIRAANHALSGLNFFDEHFDQVAQEGHPGQPILVERLDNVNAGYYLIPWDTSVGTELVIRIDASTGILLSIAQISEPDVSYFFNIMEALARAKVELPGVEFGIPSCLWMPCSQSTTPMRPFYRFPFDGGALYVDMDGKVHRHLTPLGYGG
jgi:hypothetical protein